MYSMLYLKYFLIVIVKQYFPLSTQAKAVWQCIARMADVGTFAATERTQESAENKSMRARRSRR